MPNPEIPHWINLSEEGIVSSVVRNGGILGVADGDYYNPHIPLVVGGWEIRVLDKGFGIRAGVFAAIATTPATLAVQEEATIRVLREIADERQLIAGIPENCELPYPGLPTESGEDRDSRIVANGNEIWLRRQFFECGDIGTYVVPFLKTELMSEKRKRGTFLFSDEKWRYFAIENITHIHPGDDRHRVWVRRNN